MKNEWFEKWNNNIWNEKTSLERLPR